jgi:hypothetical protein
MRTNWLLTPAVLAVSVTAVAAAQTAKAGKPAMDDAMSATYTGCLESVNHGASFLLTKVHDTEPMQGDMAMKHHDDAAMKGDGGEKMDAMATKSFALAGAGLEKHVGHKVSVTGSLSDGSMGAMRQDVSTLTVKTLKMIAKSCS